MYTKYGKPRITCIERKNVLYMIKIKNKDIIKIGHSRDIESAWKRYLTVNAYNHLDCEFFGYLECNNAHNFEKEIHKKFKSFKIKNEWFEIDAESFFNLYRFKKYKKIYPKYYQNSNIQNIPYKIQHIQPENLQPV